MAITAVAPAAAIYGHGPCDITSSCCICIVHNHMPTHGHMFSPDRFLVLGMSVPTILRYIFFSFCNAACLFLDILLNSTWIALSWGLRANAAFNFVMESSISPRWPRTRPAR